MSMLGLLCAAILTCGPAWADCGSVPFDAPLMADMDIVTGEAGKAVRFDPLEVTVFEPGQRALILWNGEEEILLLSTEQRASQKTAVLEVIPLPARPSVRLGSFETFEKAQRLMVEKRMWVMAHGGARAGRLRLPEAAGRIDFQQKLGAHDLTVAQVLDGDGFVEFVQDYLQERYESKRAPIRPEFVKIIQGYIDEGFDWFAFDVIWLNDKENGSREPIEYRFRSDSVFYPMRISTLERGKTRVEMLVFTAEGAKEFQGLEARHVDIQRPVPVAVEEVEALDEHWQGFFPEGGSLAMDQWKVEGNIATFTSDIVVR